MSKDFFKIINAHRYLFFSIFIIGLIFTSYFYFTSPITYSAKALFRYIEPEGATKITKVDINETITYESITPGSGGLYIPSLINSDSLKISFNTGNGIYTVVSKSILKDFPINEVNNFLDFVVITNINFLNEKLLYATSKDEEIKFKALLENPTKSFPLIIKADSIEIIDKRYLILFFGFIASLFVSLTGVIIKERVDEV